MSDNIGPYTFTSASAAAPLQPEAFSALTPLQQERILLDRQSRVLFTSALGDSQDEDISQTKVKLNGRDFELGRLTDLAENLSHDKKMVLVRGILNQNMAYVPPETDAVWQGHQRPTAPMQNGIDYAQTLGESLKRGKGDCEDFAIAGAEIARRMGIAPDNIAVMRGHYQDPKGATMFEHANLAVKDEKGNWEVLEIVNNKVTAHPADSFLEKGIEGYKFIPTAFVRADGEFATAEPTQNNTPALPTLATQPDLAAPDPDMAPAAPPARPIMPKRHHGPRF
jgi:predicted transglutaminase-like cysteine proteinase